MRSVLRTSAVTLLLLAGASAARAQSAAKYTISTVAGLGFATFTGQGATATSAQLFNPHKVAADSAGNLYFADYYFNQVFKVSAAGIITLLAGTGKYGYGGDGGPATSALLYDPAAVALDAAGANLYIADSDNEAIRRVNLATGIITTVAGNGSLGASGDNGAATLAKLNTPFGVALDAAGNIYIADSGNNKIRKVTASTGIITTIAGTGTSNYTGNGGKATAATLAGPLGLAVDPSGNIYIADTQNNVVRKVTAATGIITGYAGNGNADDTGDGGKATAATFDNPWDVALDAAGNVYIADYYNWQIRKVTAATGIVNVFAGTGDWGLGGDGGPALSAQISQPIGVTIDAAGNVYISQQLMGVIRKVVASGTISTVAGIPGVGLPTRIGDGGPALSALFIDPVAVATDAAGNLYIADDVQNRIRKVTSSGSISTLAGTGVSGSTGTTAATAQLEAPDSMAVDTSGNIYVGEDYDVREITASGGISTPPALAAQLQYTNGVKVAFDKNSGSLYVADPYNAYIWKLTSAGALSIYAGNGTSGFSGDGGPATKAALGQPAAVAVDGQGNIYIADYINSNVRKVTPAGIISTFAGNGTAACGVDGGQAAAATLSGPWAVAADTAGNVYIVDYDCSQLRVVAPSGIISTIAGTTSYGFSGDGGPATAARLNGPTDLALDAAGNIYIADSGNARIRKLTTGVAPQISAAGVTNAASQKAGPIAPGEMVTIYGSAIGPSAGQGAQLSSAGLVATSLGQTQVLFGGTPAPLIYVSSGQVNAVVPYSVAGAASVPLQIQSQGVTSNTVTLNVAPASPAIFVIGGAGQGAILNQDYSVNGPANPAAAGSVIQLYATGEGVTNPPGTDGKLANGPAYPAPAAPVSVTIGGQPANVVFAGTAPGGIAGFLQVNATVPDGTGSGSVPVVLTVGGIGSPAGVTVAIR